MQPLTILAADKLLRLLVTSNALQVSVNGLATANAVQVPAMTSGQVLLTSAGPDLSDKNMQLTYPRVCIYSTGVKNTQLEKFRSLSGTLPIVAEIWSSGTLVGNTDGWLHYYVEAVTDILRSNIGDWGDGMFFSGAYEVQMQQPKPGGLGYVESAKLTCSLNVSRT